MKTTTLWSNKLRSSKRKFNWDTCLPNQDSLLVLCARWTSWWHFSSWHQTSPFSCITTATRHSTSASLSAFQRFCTPQHARSFICWPTSSRREDWFSSASFFSHLRCSWLEELMPSRSFTRIHSSSSLVYASWDSAPVFVRFHACQRCWMLLKKIQALTTGMIQKSWRTLSLVSLWPYSPLEKRLVQWSARCWLKAMALEMPKISLLHT